LRPALIRDINSTPHNTKNTTHIKTIGSLILVLMGLTYAFPSVVPFSNASSAVTPPSAIGLVLTARPPLLPADGNSYPSIVIEFENLTSGMPFIPQTNTQVLLSSSSLQVGSVPSTVVFPAGNLFLTIDFQTTNLPGSTTINAYAAGYEPASLIVSTSKVGGMAATLAVFVAPAAIPADPKLTASVVVEVLDSLGNPVELSHPLVVTLTSSNSQVGSLSSSTVIIPIDGSFSQVLFTPTYTVGSTTVTAAATGFPSASAALSTIGPIPRRLAVSITPSILLAAPNENATVTIQLQDNLTQAPVYAPSPIEVVVTSGNNATLPVPNPIVFIPKGSSYVSFTIHPAGSCTLPYPNYCQATLTASAQGFVTGVATAKTQNAHGTANTILLSFAPTVLLPDNFVYQGAVVTQLAFFNASTSTYSPVTASTPQTIYARSSNNATIQVSPIPGVVPTGWTHINFSATTTFLPGSVSITAQEKGLTPDTETLTSYGVKPDTLVVQFAPNQILDTGDTYNIVFVTLINSATNQPAKAPSPVIVTLASTVASLGSIQSTITIPAGQTNATASFTTILGVEGSTQIIATASGYNTATGTLTIDSQTPTNLGVLASPTIVLTGGQTYQNLIVQLQGPAGNPEEASSSIPVRLVTNANTSGMVPSLIVIPAGATFVVVPFNSTLTPGLVNVTAFQTGFQPGLAQVQTLALPMKVAGQITSQTLALGGSTSLSVYVTASQVPLVNATVVWKALSGTFSNAMNMTNSTGVASATYKAPGVPGTVLIQIQVTKAGYQPYTYNSTIVVGQPQTCTGASCVTKGPTPWYLQTYFGLQLWMLLVIVIAIVLVAAVVVKKARGGGEYEE
jgi:hypothetical protein